MSGFLQHLETQSLISCRPIHAKPSAIFRSDCWTDYFGTFWNLYKMSANKNILKLASSRPFQTKKAILVNVNWGIFALKLAAKSSPLDNGSLNYSENLRSTLCFWRFITHGKYDKITLFFKPKLWSHHISEKIPDYCHYIFNQGLEHNMVILPQQFMFVIFGQQMKIFLTTTL